MTERCGGKYCNRPVVKVTFSEKDQWYHADFMGMDGVPDPASPAHARPKENHGR